MRGVGLWRPGGERGLATGLVRGRGGGGRAGRGGDGLTWQQPPQRRVLGPAAALATAAAGSAVVLVRGHLHLLGFGNLEPLRHLNQLFTTQHTTQLVNLSFRVPGHRHLLLLPTIRS